MKITIFTPSYNRAYTLDRLYKSLLNQTFKDFEWVIVDDGSTDDTESVVEAMKQKSAFFDIIYVKTKNGGKHRAVNKGVQLASGEMFFIVDSDDWLPETSLEKVIKYENAIPDSQKVKFAGVSGLKCNEDNKEIGSTFDGEYFDCTYIEGGSNNITGDKAEVYYTALLKKYPFPEFENENFIMESVVWNAIASDGYKLRYFNENIYYCEYLPDGLTNSGFEKFRNTPKGYGLYLSQRIKFGKLIKLNKWNAIFNYYRMFNNKLSFRQIASNLDMNSFWLYFRLFGMRIYYKLYNR